MESFSTELFLGTLALVGAVILVAALLSGFIERTGLPQVAVLLGMGAALGPAGLGMLNITLDSPILRIVATLGLALVLFTDAVSLDLREVRRHAGLAALMLGPGTLLSAALLALTAWVLLGLPVAAAVILGAALASTDPILLRGMLRNSGMSAGARLALRLESGMNDVLLLPIVIIAMAFLQQGAMTSFEFARVMIDLFILGPGAGVLIGLTSVSVLDIVRKRIGVRRDYESLYAIGVAFTAFAAAESVGGSGFLAAFAAGLTISALDVELCDCFLEYGETTAEMILLFAFVVLGSSLIWSGLAQIGVATLIFTVIVLLSRLPIMWLALGRTGLDVRGRLLIGWFGPRGLGALLFVLLPVFAGLPIGEQLFAICSLVVIFSVVLHGGTPIFVSRKNAHRRGREGRGETETIREAREGREEPEETHHGARGETETIREAREGREETPIPLSLASVPSVPSASSAVQPTVIDLNAAGEDPEDARYYADRISIPEMERLRGTGETVIVLDVRTERSIGRSDMQAKGSIRFPPEDVVERATVMGLPLDAWLVTYCT
ncbi:MAG: cation:proton antiporter [Chloroflexaceae bacterium]|jgi:NhaP-type Na+/H+ or K+/H+ antiporter|nr:cation:proton antiporter [Chloroflexaceae bacterium]